MYHSAKHESGRGDALLRTASCQHGREARKAWWMPVGNFRRLPGDWRPSCTTYIYEERPIPGIIQTTSMYLLILCFFTTKTSPQLFTVILFIVTHTLIPCTACRVWGCHTQFRKISKITPFTCPVIT